MQSYPLRAVSIDGISYVDFDLTDYPCYLIKNTFILAKRPGTPILSSEKLFRGTENGEFFEWDLVKSNGRIYRVVYNKGFKAEDTSTGTLQPLSILTKTKIIGTEIDTKTTLKSSRVFKGNKVIISFDQLIGQYSQDELLIRNRLLPRCLPMLLQQSAGDTVNGVGRIFFGDTVFGGRVVMRGGVICIDYGNEYKELESLKETSI